MPKRSFVLAPVPKNDAGFTLVELMVVIVILAILATVGLVAFRNVGGDTRDAKRKADIDAIAKAYESTYKAGTGTYDPLTDANFTSGKMPKPPEGGTSDYQYLQGPNKDSTDNKRFKICAKLEKATADCTDTSDVCYCQSNAL